MTRNKNIVKIKTISLHGPLFCVWYLFPMILMAQSDSTHLHQWRIGMEYKPRVEYRNGAFRPLNKSESPAALISSRARIPLEYTWNNKVTLRMVPQSVNIWGENKMVQHTTNTTGNLSLFEAWARFRLTEYWQIQAGRQIISLDDERVFGALDWAQGGRAHDMLSVQYKNPFLTISGFFAYNQNYRALYNGNLNNPTGHLYNSTGAYPEKWMQGLWGKIFLGDKAQLSLLVTNIVFQNAAISVTDAPTNAMQLFGGHLNTANDKVKSAWSGYAQTGHDATGKPVMAWMLAGQAGVILGPEFEWILGSDFLSGNDLGTKTHKNRSFNPIFGTNHKFYGSMDYFYAENGHKGAGLSDTYLRFRYMKDDKTSFQLTVHQFLMPTDIFGTIEHYSKDLGREIDFDFTYKVTTFAILQGGYSMYLTTPTIEFLKDTPDAGSMQHWAWLSISVTPTFNFNSND